VGEAQWIKIRNTAYSQWVGRERLFERERESDRDLYLWDARVAACEMTCLNGYDFLLRSSSFEYLVPLPVSSSANPLSVI